jgi:hypothetical protein
MQNLPQCSRSFFETHTSEQQNQSERKAEEYIPKYNNFMFNEKDCFRILVKNDRNETHEFYVLYFNSEVEETC